MQHMLLLCLGFCTAFGCHRHKKDFSSCKKIIAQIENSSERGDIPMETNVFCVRWNGTEASELHELTENGVKIRIGGDFVLDKICGDTHSVNYFEIMAPNGRFNKCYSQCKLRHFHALCRQQFGAGHWSVQPDASMNEWNPFLTDKRHWRFEPAGISVKPVKDWPYTVVFSHSFSLNNIRETISHC